MLFKDTFSTLHEYHQRTEVKNAVDEDYHIYGVLKFIEKKQLPTDAGAFVTEASF